MAKKSRQDWEVKRIEALEKRMRWIERTLWIAGGFVGGMVFLAGTIKTLFLSHKSWAVILEFLTH